MNEAEEHRERKRQLWLRLFRSKAVRNYSLMIMRLTSMSGGEDVRAYVCVCVLFLYVCACAC